MCKIYSSLEPRERVCGFGRQCRRVDSASSGAVAAATAIAFVQISLQNDMNKDQRMHSHKRPQSVKKPWTRCGDRMVAENDEL